MPRPSNDPNARQKERAERELAASLAALLDDQYEDLLVQLSQTTTPQVPQFGWWEEWQVAMVGALGLSMFQISENAALSMAEYTGIAVDYDAILNAAQGWSSQYSFDLVRGINDTSRAALQDLLQDFYSGSIDFDTLEAMLSSRYGATRAASIATTEVTRAWEQGVDMYQTELEGLGLDVDRIWHCEPDACPLCSPYDGVLESEGWDDGEPPLHPNCACLTEIVVLPGSKNYTRDEKCSEPAIFVANLGKTTTLVCKEHAAYFSESELKAFTGSANCWAVGGEEDA